MEVKEYKNMFEVEDTHFWYRGMRTISATLLEKFIPRKKGNRILDAGCGTGSGIIFLRQYGDTEGFDIAKEAVAFCHKRGLKQVTQGSIDDIRFKNDTFDILTCFDVLGQQEVLNDVKAMREFYRVLKPGGILLIRTAAYNWLYGYHDVAVHTRYRYNSEELKYLLNKTKFQPLTITHANVFFFPLIAFLRLVRRFHKLENFDKSDVNKVNPILNMILYYPLLFESFLIRFIALPFGLSIFAIAKK